MTAAGPLVLAVDQGSSATKAVLVDDGGRVRAHASVAVDEQHPAPGHVEQSATALVDSVRAAVARCLTGHDPRRVAAIGLSTQRESVLLWDAATGEPAGPVLSWQDRRTADEVAVLAADPGVADQVRRTTGLPLDPMFSAPKARRLLDTADPDRRLATAGRLRLGTVDSWLLHQLAGRHCTDAGNAARTQLLDLDTGAWDPALLDLFGVPAGCLPEVVPSRGRLAFCAGLDPLPDGVPVTAVLGDSHAALLGHGIRRPGQVKTTYGTGSSVMGLVEPGTKVPDGLCRTIAWTDDVPHYAAEGNIRATGATVAWLATLLGTTPQGIADLAAGTGSDGVHLVPAFTGLGAPWWDGAAVGLVSGLGLGTGPAQLARAAIESIAFQVEDVVAAVDALGPRVATVRADGGAGGNDQLLQLQADLSGRTVRRPAEQHLSALGAAHLAGLGCGLWTEADLEGFRRAPATAQAEFRPAIGEDERRARRAGWHDAVDRARGRATTGGPR